MIIGQHKRGTFKGTQILTSKDLRRDYSTTNDISEFNKPMAFFYEASFIIFVDDKGMCNILKNRFGSKNSFDDEFLKELKTEDNDGYNKLIETINFIKYKNRIKKLKSL
ncbi:hypothetical protein M0Q50_07845 [bacterium]|jgi:hypothetical protein|nr:hypothetical protein [bacterium]